MDDVASCALSWLGTPYHAGARIKGVGVDCAMLLAEVYHEAGLVPRIDLPPYPADFGLHRSDEVFMSWLVKYGTEVAEPKAGRAALFRFGRCYSHGGIMVSDDQIVHASQREGFVCLSSLLSAELAGRQTKFFEVQRGR